MVLINKTLAFATNAELEGVSWIKTVYMPLLDSCPLISRVSLYQIQQQEDADVCFALQINIGSDVDYQKFVHKYETDFDTALQMKFRNNIGVFTSVLKEI